MATVCILAAGKGTRAASFGGTLHKGLLPLGNRAVVSRIIEQFPPATRFVFALGHLAEQVRDYIAVAHPDLHATFVEVDRYEGPGAGPGYSLWCCRAELAEPFYLTACDTLTSVPPPLTENLMGTYRVDDPELWCTVDTGADGLIRRLHYKTPQGSHDGFIGFAGIRDHAVFWAALGARIGGEGEGEYQVNDGFAALVDHGLRAVPMDWIDTGTEENYLAALPRFEKNLTFLGKTTDVTYRLGDRVIKFFPEPGAARRRFERGRANPAFATPLDCRGAFFSYRWVQGCMLSARLDGGGCRSALEWLREHLWLPRRCDPAAFAAACRRFYGAKTLSRLDDYLRAFQPEGEGGTLAINGLPCRPVRQAVADLPEAFWSGGVPVAFHGDLHDENIVVTPDGGFALIDWRQDFAGLAEVGDLYYDLAKFHHTLDLSVAAMEAGDYWIRPRDDGIAIGHGDTDALEAARAAFREFVVASGYDRHRVELLSALIFVNMAPLYDAPMARYLYHLGRLRLEQTAYTGGSST